MTMTFNELLGEQLLQHNEVNNEYEQISTSQLNGKTVAVYFSAHWCSPCRKITPKLAEVYKNANNETKDKFEIVFVSWDEDQAEFDEYFKEMPWKALPFSDRDRKETLGEKFNVEGIPTLVVLSPTFEIISSDGVEEIRVGSNEALHQWLQGKRLLWSREAREGEYVWKDITCSECYMNPLIGPRHGCTNPECEIDLCETCLSKNKHEHPLVEYLLPNKRYSLEQLFKSVPYLLDPNSEDKIETKIMWEDGVKSVGFYFSPWWLPDSYAFTPKLAEIYKEAQTSSQSFRIVFLPDDHNEMSFNEYRSTMPWPAVPLNSDALLKAYFEYDRFPKLFIVTRDGKKLSRLGREEVSRKGVEALKTWAQGEKLVPPTIDEFHWLYGSCNGCQMESLIGRIYRCTTCPCYVICSACEKKGHEHPLELVPLSTEVESD